MKPQIDTGWRGLLSHPFVYEGFQFLIGGRSLRRTLVQEYFRPRPGERVLDVGCGPGRMIEFLPEVDYVGVDLSPAYIEYAKRTYGSRGTFLVADATSLESHEPEPFDLVTAIGLLHHLADEGVVQLLHGLRARLSGPESRLVTIDGCYAGGQSRIAAFLLSKDRGRHVRSPEGYSQLAQRVFGKVQVMVRHDLLRIPFSFCILKLSF
jgi:SAM-dependent methyltransferase